MHRISCRRRKACSALTHRHSPWGGERLDLERPHIASLREFEAVNAALDALGSALDALAARQPIDFVATDLQRAFSALGHVSEPVAAEEVLDGIFSRFCIGK